MIRKILKTLKITQTVSNKDRREKGLKPLGRGFLKAHRINPYNPLSYITVFLIVAIGILLFGLVGIWSEIGTKNPFKWD